MKKLLFLVLLLIPGAASAQQYFRRTIYMNDSLNRSLVQDAELLSVVLLHGYLEGDLKAYTFDVKSEDVKWKPVPQELVPEEWDSTLDYYQGDRVAYQGKYYELVFDFVVAGTQPPPNERWSLLDLHGDVVSTIHSFPEARDSTTKTHLLKNLAQFTEFSSSYWDDLAQYYIMDIVSYNGQFYECITDHAGHKKPDVETQYWRLTGLQLQFYLPRDLSTISVLCARGDQASLIPQMLSLSYMSMFRETRINPGLNFYYQDVVNYLARQRQMPLLFQSQAGYVGAPQLVSGVYNSLRVVELIQEALKAGTLKPTKQDIVNAVSYDLFINEKKGDSQGNWWATQDLNTHDVWLGMSRVSDSSALYQPFLKVPWKSMEAILKAKEPTARLWNYVEALEANKFKSWLDTLDIDTLAAKEYHPVTDSPLSRVYFTEQRTAPVQTNRDHALAMKSLWTLLQQAFDAGTIQVQSPQTRLFVCDQPFPEITFELDGYDWVFEKGMTLDPNYDVTVDSTVFVNPVSGIGVQYKRFVSPKKSKAPLFEPVKLSVRYFSPVSMANYDYFFMWEDVVKLTTGRKDLQGLMDAVRTGKLKSDYSELVYGLIGEK